MAMKRVELCPGVRLNMVQTDRFKTGCFSINVLTPLNANTASVNALIPSVLLRGCCEYPDIRMISQRLDTLYGASVGALIRKKGEVQSVGLYADFLEDRYAENERVFVQVMSFIRSLLFDPCLKDGGFIEEYVSGEKQNLINTINSGINNKRSFAIMRTLKHMCKGEAYSVPRLGEQEALDGVDGKSLYLSWQELLASSQIELFYLGQQDEKSVLEQMQQLVSMLPHREELSEITTNVFIPDRECQMIEEALDVTQGKLVIGFRTPITAMDDRYPAMMLLNAVFGAGMTSKLFVKIREEQSLCYYASSSLDRMKGIVLVNSGIEFDKYKIARDGILEQLRLCQEGQITDEEIELARNYLISNLRAYNDSPGQMDDFVVGQSIIGSTGTIDDLIMKLRTVTLENVIEAANTMQLDTVYFLKGGDCT